MIFSIKRLFSTLVEVSMEVKKLCIEITKPKMRILIAYHQDFFQQTTLITTVKGLIR